MEWQVTRTSRKVLLGSTQWRNYTWVGLLWYQCCCHTNLRFFFFKLLWPDINLKLRFLVTTLCKLEGVWLHTSVLKIHCLSSCYVLWCEEGISVRNFWLFCDMRIIKDRCTHTHRCALTHIHAHTYMYTCMHFYSPLSHRSSCFSTCHGSDVHETD